jgi:hypothetical protein
MDKVHIRKCGLSPFQLKRTGEPKATPLSGPSTKNLSDPGTIVTGFITGILGRDPLSVGMALGDWLAVIVDPFATAAQNRRQEAFLYWVSS